MRKLATIILASLFFTTAVAQNTVINETQLRKLQQAEFYISHYYVDSLYDEKLVDAAIEGMLKQLDPHSTYIKAKDVERTTENLNGSFEGIGVQFNMVEDTLVVVQPVSGGPSERMGIMAGDRIVSVNDTSIAGVKMSKDEIMTRLRGPKGTQVKLGVIRPGIKGVNTFMVTRDKIPVYTIDAHFMIDESIGYIRIGSFGQTTYDEFMTAVQELKDKGMKRLVIDLQSNGGGYLQTAVKLSNEFLPKEEVIVSQKGNTSIAQFTQAYKADGNGTLCDLPVVVLVDSYSASASEILTGAFQDNDRGVVVGRRTFGKGLVQRPFELIDKSVIRLTTAHYYTPTGRCIQKPYEMGNSKSYQKDMEDRLNSGELTNIDSIHFDDSLKYETKHLKRTVYGGGGIMPDYYVPLDTTLYTKLHREMSAKGCINTTVIKYLDNHRKRFNKNYKTFEQYVDSYNVENEVYGMLKAEATKAEISIEDSEFENCKPMLEVQLKALIARDLWDMNAYFQIANSTNPIFRKGLEIIKTSEPDDIMRR